MGLEQVCKGYEGFAVCKLGYQQHAGTIQLIVCTNLNRLQLDLMLEKFESSPQKGYPGTFFICTSVARLL